MICFVGCYTDDAHPEGIHVIDVDPESGALRRISTVRLPNAIYQAQSPCGRYLVSCAQGGLAAFRIKDDVLIPTDRVEWEGQCLCHVFVMPDGSGYAVVDLGLDRISVYPQDRHFLTEPRGAGPRHLAYHPNGRFAFLASELGNLVSVYRLTGDGRFEYLSSESTLPEGWKGESAVAAIRVSPDGRRVYVSNRGHDSIATFDFDEKSERLTKLFATPLSGALVSLRGDSDAGSFSEIAVLGGFYRPSSVSILSWPR